MNRRSSVISSLPALLLIAVCLCIAVSVHAQNKTDSTLNEVKVHGRHKASNDTRINDFSPGQKVHSIDSLTLLQYQQQSMANLLSQQVPVFIKSYGFNGLATLNFRGSSAAQSQVLWNGIPIQNAALGLADVSALPVLLMNKVNIVYGGSAALWGSGNVGGALLLENDVPVFGAKRSLSVSAGAGSFGQYTGGLTGNISSKRWYFSANVFAQAAQNNFSYTSISGVKENMPNSKLNSYDVLLRSAYRIGDGNTISLSAWYQQYTREIPPALFEAYSDKKETDGSLRILAEWDKKTAKNAWYAKSSFIRDDMDFSYEAVALHWNYITYQYYQEVGWKKYFGRYGQLLLFAPLQVSWITRPDSSLSRQQDKVALAAAYDIKLLHSKLDIAANMRIEMITQQSDTTIHHNIFLPGVNASYTITHWLAVRANVQRTYRAPTLNELYYYPGGNKYLKPEQGWTEDAGYTIKLTAGRFSIYHDLSLYNRSINDWIMWIGGAVWTPHNIAQVHSRGVETENNLVYTIDKWKIHFGINTSYVLATTVTSYVYNDGSVGKQIPYTPRYNGQANIGFAYRRFYFNYNHTYTGYRFITTDESGYLAPYQVGGIQLMYNTSRALQLTAMCNNIWSQQYQVVNGRPMPGLNWQLGARLQLL